MSHILFGIDYGSKLSGNTVIAVLNDNKIYFLDVDKGADADEFIFQAAQHFKPEIIFLDAPLSLPGRYTGKGPVVDYHFRQADRELNAMSPMFLGGLTARAIQLKDRLESSISTKVYETYPKAIAHNYQLKDYGNKKRKSNLIACRTNIIAKLNPRLLIDCQEIKTWHHLDALLALYGAMRFVMGQGLTYGHEEEGLIHV